MLGAVHRARRRQLCSRSPIVPYSLSKNCWQIEPIGSPLVTVLFTKGMIAADFLGDRTGIRIGHVLPNGPQQEAVGLFFLAAIALKLPATSTARSWPARDAARSDAEWSWALPASLTVDPAETAADITPEVPTSVIYADHSRPVRSGNADQTTSTGVLSAPIEPTQTGRVPLEWLAGVASLGKLLSVRRSHGEGRL